MTRLVKNSTWCMVHGVLCILLLSACRPRSVLSPKQMEDIFVDLHTADGILQEAGYNYGHDEALRGYYQVVLDKHGVTQARFDSSLVWYTANPTIFDKIYPKVIDRLQARLDEYLAREGVGSISAAKSVDDWLRECQEGYDRGLWHKKIEKSTEKFVYIEKLL